MTQQEPWSIALALNLQEWKTLLSEGCVRVATQRLCRWTGSPELDARSFDLAPIGKFGDSGDCIIAFISPPLFQLGFPTDAPSGNVADVELKSVTAFHAVDSTAVESLATDAARAGVRVSGAEAADAWSYWLEPRLRARHFQSGSRLASLFGLPVPVGEQEKWTWRMSAFNGQKPEPTASNAAALDRLLLNYAEVFDAARGYSETAEHAPRAAIALAEIAHGLDAVASDELNTLATREFAETPDLPAPKTFEEQETSETPPSDNSLVQDNAEPKGFWERFLELAPDALDSELTAQFLSDILRTVHRARNGRLLPKLVVDAVGKTAGESGDLAARAHAFILGTVLGPSKVQTLAVALDPAAISKEVSIQPFTER